MPNSGGQDCASLLEFAPSLEADEFLCEASKEAEGLCCPGSPEPDQQEDVEEPADEPADEEAAGEEETVPEETAEDACVVCASGLTVPETTPYGPRTCGQVLLDAADTAADANRCGNLKQAEGTCCPPPAEDPCQFCPDGLSVDESTSVGQVTCGRAVADAATTEADDNICGRIQSLEATCCPSPASDPCPVCPDGLTVDTSTVINQAQGSTCGGLLSDALLVESDSDDCESMLGVESLCCPGESDGCPVCPDGLTVAETTVINENPMRTCATLLTDALTTDPDSNRCRAMKESEAACCPPAAEDPCPVCPGGITVDGTTPVTDQRTCDDLVTDAGLVEADDDVCESMLGLMEVCCPEGSEVETTDAPVTPPSVSPVAAVVTDAPVAAVVTDAPVAVPAAVDPELPASSPAPSFLAASEGEPVVTPAPVEKVVTPAPTLRGGAATDAPFAVAGGDGAVLPGGDVPTPGIEFGGETTPIEAPPAPSGGVRRTLTAAGAAALLLSLARLA